MTFVDNHDVTRIASILKDKRHLYPVYGTLMTMPGIPCIYYGSEWGEEGIKAPDNDYALRPCFESPKPNEFTQYLRRLISFRQKSDALCNGSYRNVLITNRQLIFERKTDRERVFVAINAENSDFTANHGELQGEVQDLLGGERFHMNGQLTLKPYSVQILFDWQTQMSEHHAWNAVFWCNHDQPRVVSRFGSEDKYWKESAKMLGTVIHMLRGTPYIYQGEELGMTNAGFTDISQYRDVESINHFRILQEKGLTESDAYRILQIHSRDNSRTPMQWNASTNAGFTSGDTKPWISVNPNYIKINAEQQMREDDSIFAYYQKLIRIRKELDVVAYGDITPLAKDHPSVFAYRRSYQNEDMIVVNHFYGKDTDWKIDLDLTGYDCILGNYSDYTKPQGGTWRLRPYETMIWYRK